MLEFELSLEGTNITKANVFTGDRLFVSALGFLNYRVYGLDGTLQAAKVTHHALLPAKVDLAKDLGSDSPKAALSDIVPATAP